MDWEEFKDKVYWILVNFVDQYKILYEYDRITFYVDEYEFIYTKTDYERFLCSLNNYKYNNFILHKEEKYEVVIYELKDNEIGFFMFDYQGRVYNSDESMSLKVSDISDEMLYFLIKDIDMNKYFKAFNIKYIDEYQLSDFNLWKLLKLAMNNLKSIAVNYQGSIKEEDAVNLINSYFFEISLENSELFRIATTSENVFGKETCYDTVQTMSRFKVFPKRIYNQELLDQYNIATMSNDPMLQFIGYYHVLEYFFKRVLADEAYNYLLENICGFKNYKFIEEDLQTICEMINIKYNSLMRITEQNVLELVLKNYVDIDILKKQIDKDFYYKADYDDNLIRYGDYVKHSENREHYMNHMVSFSKGNKVDLDGDDVDVIYKNLKERIYKTRNAIVHSKASVENTVSNNYYKPFENDVELENEIPLIKAIAEQIIINTAEKI